ncbi:hypothetical protein Leryth_027532 [Lithospermum erythrorhizon]|nr:hypothetical protein Leryth_027532 [Lithospermum erythrorhizon]
MSEVYVGNISPPISADELELQFKPYGQIRRIKLPSGGARGYAFVEFVNRRDALFAIHSWDGKFNWRVDLSRNSKFGVGTNSCYRCGGLGHFARDCGYDYDIKNKGLMLPQRGRTKNQVSSTSTLKPVPPPPPPWVELPVDITANILRKIGSNGLLRSAQEVCSTWRMICRDLAMWRVIDMWKLGDDYEFSVHGYNVLCRHAVDLSQGQVTECNIEGFLTDDLLEYIAERCGQLRRLRLLHCHVSGKTFSKALKRFPLLEELHLQWTPIEKDDIEAIGRSCPMLKTFVLNCRGCIGGVLKSSEEALAVGKSMPELRHLQLFGNRMTNEGLEAILNGCPKLESLDLRQCFNLDLQGELGKRCIRQIKNLRRPNDSTRDYEWDATVANFGSHRSFCELELYYDGEYDDSPFRE